jgi:hypothetical protein
VIPARAKVESRLPPRFTSEPYYGIRREGEVGIARAQGLIRGRDRVRMEPVQPMRPTANNDELTEPRSESRD